MANRLDDEHEPSRPESRGLGRVGHLVGAVSNRVLGELDPDIVVGQLDVDALLDRVDIDHLLDRVTVDRFLDRIDVDRLLDRVAVDQLLDRVAVDQLLDRVAVDQLLDRMDIDRLLGRADVDGLVRRVDVPQLVDRLDLDHVLATVDLDALVARIDTDALLARVDIDALVVRIDADALLARVDLDQVLDRIDLDTLVARLDVDTVVARIDADALLARVDLDRVLDRIDLDTLVARLDIDAVVARLDLDAIVDRLDVAELVQRAGIPELVADSTGQLAGSALDLARRQLVAVDVATWRISQRLLRRNPTELPPGPSGLVDESEDVALPDPQRSRVRARVEVSGFYAGPVSRLLAFGADVALATVVFTASTAAVAWLLETVAGIDLTPGDGSIWWVLAGVAWLFVYWGVSTAVAGRTPAQGVAGLRVTARDGSPLTPGRALVRTLVLPLSVPGFLGGAWMMVDHERRALQDLAASSTVVYDWGGRPAEMPTPLSHWLAEHDRPASTGEAGSVAGGAGQQES